MTTKLSFEDAWGNALENLKCTKCSNFLSYFPIYLSNEGNSICGRCYDAILEKDNYVHNAVYEGIAQFQTFPCCYHKEGCQEKFLPAGIPEHENTCIYQTLKCPVAEFTDCKWEGTSFEFSNHCNRKHSDLKLQNGEFVINLAESHDANNFLELDSILFTVSYKFCATNKFLELSICNVKRRDPIYTCTIQFTSVKKKLIVECDTIPFPERKVTKLFLDSLKNDIEDAPVVNSKISLRNENKQVKIETVDKDLLSVLKCALCGDYAMLHVYQRTYTDLHGNKQIICKECDGKYPKNSFERLPSLETLSNLLNYPCKNETIGCTFIGKPKAMRVHNDFCHCSQRVCPSKTFSACKWTGLLKNVSTHVEDAHKDMFKEMCSEIVEPIDDLIKGKCYFIRYQDKVFYVEFLLKMDSIFRWTVNMLEQFKNRFSYRFEIINSSKTKWFGVKRLCTPWQRPNYDSFHIDQINSSANPEIIFKIRIFED